MHKYDYAFIKTAVPGNIVGLTSIIADLKAKEDFRKAQYKETFKSLQRKAMIESVRGSNAIEGIVTSASRIKEIIDGSTPLTHDENEIAGYRDALNLIHTNNLHMDVNEDLIRTFHKMITGQTNTVDAGRYKETDNYIIEYASDGSRRIRFTPVAAKDVPGDMQQMLLAYFEARQDSDIHPLLLIPCVVLDFLCIHPFGDGNGRISRLLTVLLLYLAGYDIVRFISFEGMINTYKESYYDALKRSSEKWHENQNDYTPCIIFFLQILYKCFRELDDSFTELSVKKAKKSERVENILLNAIVPISKRDIAGKVPDISIKTIDLVVSRMLKDQRIKKIGSYKDARYMRN